MLGYRDVVALLGEEAGDAKVRDAHAVALPADEDVPRVQIPVANVPGVQVAHAGANLRAASDEGLLRKVDRLLR